MPTSLLVLFDNVADGNFIRDLVAAAARLGSDLATGLEKRAQYNNVTWPKILALAVLRTTRIRMAEELRAYGADEITPERNGEIPASDSDF